MIIDLAGGVFKRCVWQGMPGFTVRCPPGCWQNRKDIMDPENLLEIEITVKYRGHEVDTTQCQAPAQATEEQRAAVLVALTEVFQRTIDNIAEKWPQALADEAEAHAT